MDDPIAAAQAWLREAQARGIPNAEAGALATATPDGRPSVRMVLVRALDPHGFAFFTSYESRKARELEATGRAAIALYWQPLGRQVRAEGRVERLAPEESDAYFASRPEGSRIAAWASPQSRPVTGRAELDRLYAEAAERFAGGDVPRPPFWGGYRLVPDAVELWEHRENRLHDRTRFERDGEGWRAQTLGA